MTIPDAGVNAAPMTNLAPPSDPLRRVLADTAGLYVRATIASIGWRIEADALIQRLRAGPPCIIAFWHESLPSMPILWREAARDPALPRGHILASRHRDGQLIARAMRRFGLETIAGSTSRGGAASLRQLLKLLAAGHPIGLTPDGPRGPRRHAAPGVAQLAAVSGVPVFCVAAMTRAAITTASWDQMRIPLPFSRGALVAMPPLILTRTEGKSGLAPIETALNAALDRATSLCR